MKYLILLVSFLCSSITVGQNVGTISGTILDKNLQEPLAFSSVVVKDDKGTIVMGTITEDSGQFILTDLAPQTYTIEIEFIGYKSQQHSIELKSGVPVKDLTIYLEENVEMLEGVLVTSQKSTIEQRIDRKIINVGKDLISQGPSAIDIMNNLPSVNVNSDGNITFRGSQNVRILIDGKLSNLENSGDILQQIPSNTIKKIELITNPSAKYNPDGLNGIINVVLKKSGNTGWNLGVNSSVTIAQRERYNNGFSFNYKPGATNFYVEYANRFGDQITDGRVNRFDLNSNQTTRNINNRKSNNIKLGTDIYLSDKHTVSLFTNQNFYKAYFDGGKQVVFKQNESENFGLNDLLKRKNHTQIYNLDYKWLFDKDTHFLELEADYNNYNSDMANSFDFSGNTKTPFYNENIEDQRTVLTLNIDYSLPISSNSKIELGAETRINAIDNTYSVSNPNLLNSVLNYDRDIFSSYFMWGSSLGKFKFNLGSRFEYYLVNASFDQETMAVTNFDQKLFNVFPSIFVEYKANLESPHQYQLSYGRRIERPSFNQINPIRQVTTPQIIATGNLQLIPQFSNALEVNYLYRFAKNSISLSGFYRKIEDEINRIGIFDQQDPNLLRLSYDNFESNDAYGLEIGMNFEITDWWRFNSNLELYSREQQGIIDGIGVSVQNTLANIKLTNSFKISKNIRASLFGFYSGRQEVLQYELKPNYYMNAGLRYNFAKGKGSLSINVNDVFGTQRFAFETYRTVFQEGEFLRDTQQLFIGASYRFGGKVRSISRKKRDKNIKADKFL
ncbi:TonB-dependent receptor domain-containing protein [Aquimarina aquimarini]|uniref:TonB-dependent receptor domain-containing protein n=1 Tax=Aquimarina aquimarini TaxID=1191734 RepID=UPI00131EE829|nr:TonB-dependent receptor [Aquimarina aquimarini]